MKNFSVEELLMLFIIGCVIGFVLETVYCLIVNKRYESRKGLVYGPFSQVYGFGAVLLTILLYPVSQLSPVFLFIWSAVLGGVFEAVCSYFQQKVFGTVSWEYSHSRLSLFGGRTSLLYMAFWGVIGCVYIRFIHPFLFSLIGMVPMQIRTPLVVALTVFLVYDMILSALAVKRWQMRKSGFLPKNRVEEWLDEKFPDTRMERIYTNMVTVDKHETAPEQENSAA